MIVVSRSPKLTQLDEQTFDNMSQMIKAALPYMPPSSARTMAMLARFVEMRNTMKFFNQPQSAALHACSIGSRRPSTEEMLMDIRKYCDGSEAEAIDKLLGALKIGKFYEQFKEMETNPDFSNLFRAMNQYGSHSPNEDSRGGEHPVNNPFNPEQLMKNMSPDMLKNFNPEMLKNLNPEMFKNFNPDMLRNMGQSAGQNPGSTAPQEMLKNLSPEMLKNFDMNKFNQLMSAMNNGGPGGNPAPGSSAGSYGGNPAPGNSSGSYGGNPANTASGHGGSSANSSGRGYDGNPANSGNGSRGSYPANNGGPDGPGNGFDSSGFDEEQLKSLLTPEQLEMFESIRNSMNNDEP